MTITSRPCLLSEPTPPRRRQLFEGARKILYDGPELGTHVLYFKDDVCVEGDTVTINGKGILNNRISELLMTRLNDIGIETHFIRNLNMREQLIQPAENLPFSVTIHNIASGHFARRLGLEDGMPLLKPIPEFSLRSEELGYPIVALEHLTTLGWSRLDEIDDILLISQRINDFLNGQFFALNIRLISFTLEFGRLYTPDLMESRVILVDEISPDTCHLLDLTTGERLDRQGLKDNPQQAQNLYQKIAHRLGILSLDTSKSKKKSNSLAAFPKLVTPSKTSVHKKK